MNLFSEELKRAATNQLNLMEANKPLPAPKFAESIGLDASQKLIVSLLVTSGEVPNMKSRTGKGGGIFRYEAPRAASVVIAESVATPDVCTAGVGDP